jgi:hypothetical protein
MRRHHPDGRGLPVPGRPPQQVPPSIWCSRVF